MQISKSLIDIAKSIPICTEMSEKEIIVNYCPSFFGLQSPDEEFQICGWADHDYSWRDQMNSCTQCWQRKIKMEENEQMIKDSGDRTKFETGAVRDMHSGKGRMDLLPWHAIMEVSKHCEAGAVKYGEHNVDKGIPVHSLLDSGIRHAAKFITRQEDEPHLVAACWNLLWALEMMLTKPDMDDRYKEKE